MSGRHFEERLREYKKAHSMYDIAISVQQAKVQKAKKGKLNFTQITQDRLLGLLSGDLTRLAKDKEALGREITELELKVEGFRRHQVEKLAAEELLTHQDEPVGFGTRATLQKRTETKTTTDSTREQSGQQELRRGESSNQQKQSEIRQLEENDSQERDKQIQVQDTPFKEQGQVGELEPCLNSLAPPETQNITPSPEETHYDSPELDFGEEVNSSANNLSNAHILDTLRVLEGLEDNGENYKPLYLS